MKNQKTLFITQFSILLAIEAVFCFTPLGSLPIGPIVATLAMIPVIIVALSMGPKAGSLMGAAAGLFSFIVWTFMPPPSSIAVAFVFTPFNTFGEYSGNFGSLLICFVPRILIGLVAGFSYKLMSKRFPGKDTLNFALSGVLGSLTNTFLVLGGIWLFFGEQYATLLQASITYIIGITILTNGLLEAAISAIVAPVICKPLKMLLTKRM